MSEVYSDDSRLLLNVRPAIRGPKALAVTWGDGHRSVICLWNEVDLQSTCFDEPRITDDMTDITFPDRDVTVTADHKASGGRARHSLRDSPPTDSGWAH